MIQKQSNNHNSGRAHNHQEQKRHSRVQQRACFFFTLCVCVRACVRACTCMCVLKGIVNLEFVPPNTTVNSDFDCDVLRRLKETVQRKRLELWCNHNWLHHDNTPIYTSLKTTEFVTNNMVIVPRPSYSLDIVLCDFALFPKLKIKLKGRRFETV
jgi:hypothetical protein